MIPILSIYISSYSHPDQFCDLLASIDCNPENIEVVIFNQAAVIELLDDQARGRSNSDILFDLSFGDKNIMSSCEDVGPC